MCKKRKKVRKERRRRRRRDLRAERHEDMRTRVSVYYESKRKREGIKS